MQRSSQHQSSNSLLQDTITPNSRCIMWRIYIVYTHQTAEHRADFMPWLILAFSMTDSSRVMTMHYVSMQTGGRWKVSQCCGESLASPGAVLLTVESSRSVRPNAEVVSSVYLSTERRRAFIKKLTTVDTFSPSCSAIVAWISLLGRFISRKMATRVRRWISVNTILGFLLGTVDPGSVLDDAPQDRSWLLFPPT